MTWANIVARAKTCDPGYYCLVGATTPHPADATGVIGNICEVGNYCPGASAMTPCAAGYFESRTGSDACQDCPAGFYCCGSLGTGTNCLGETEPKQCRGGYCKVRSSAPALCPDGFYGDDAIFEMSSESDCIHCPEGKFCTAGFITGDCDAGYFCDFGATASNDAAKACPLGHFCPAGTPLPIRCDEGFYTLSTGSPTVAYCVPCQPGYYCIENDSVMRACPTGHFCTSVTIDPTPCREGQYQPDKYATTNDQCLDCPAGFYCNAIAIETYVGFECPKGHWCSEVAKTTLPVKCPAGTYQPYE